MAAWRSTPGSSCRSRARRRLSHTQKSMRRTVCGICSGSRDSESHRAFIETPALRRRIVCTHLSSKVGCKAHRAGVPISLRYNERLDRYFSTIPLRAGQSSCPVEQSVCLNLRRVVRIADPFGLDWFIILVSPRRYCVEAEQPLSGGSRKGRVLRYLHD